MNLYRITYTTASGDTTSSNITERTEKAAIKDLKAYHKESGFPVQAIASVELIQTNVTATKQQERDTLEAIKRMVEELGPQSYLSTAFDGCFADAEQNIDDDAAYSMKDRFEHEREKRHEADNRYNAIVDKLEAASKAIESLKAENAALAARIMSEDDLHECRALTLDRMSEHEERMSKAAAEVLERATEPDSESFRQAVKDHRNAKHGYEYDKELLERINRIIAGA